MTNQRTQQEPLHSGLGAATTALEAVRGIDLREKTAIVTGGAAGIGIETTRALVSAGAEVVAAVRDLDKARTAVAGRSGVSLEPLDLFDPASIDAFATRFLASGRPLHLLIGNAGIMATPLVRDTRGEGGGEDRHAGARFHRGGAGDEGDRPARAQARHGGVGAGPAAEELAVDEGARVGELLLGSMEATSVTSTTSRPRRPATTTSAPAASAARAVAAPMPLVPPTMTTR